MAGFQKELLAHLNEMTELNSQIAKRNATLAMKLSDFERDICQIRDYYDRIIDSTKTVVDYGSDQTVIPSLAWPDRLFLQGVYRLQYKRP